MGAEKQKCLGCRCQLTFGDQRVQFGRLRCQGLTKQQARDVMPRCKKCVGKYLFTDPQAPRLPHVQIRRRGGMVYLMRVNLPGWHELYAELSGHEYVCVREGDDLFLVATTLPAAGIESHPSSEVAKYVEKAIMSRPRETAIRFLASEGWGGVTAPGGSA